MLINPDQPIIGENHSITTGGKQKKTQINLDQNLDTAAARSTPPLPPLDQRFHHRLSTQINPSSARITASQQKGKKKRKKKTQINVSSTVMCDVDVGRRMMFGFEERREQMRKREGRERREHE